MNTTSRVSSPGGKTTFTSTGALSSQETRDAVLKHATTEQDMDRVFNRLAEWLATGVARRMEKGA